MTAIRINPESLEQDGTVTLPGMEIKLAPIGSRMQIMIKLLILKIVKYIKFNFHCTCVLLYPQGFSSRTPPPLQVPESADTGGCSSSRTLSGVREAEL